MLRGLRYDIDKFRDAEGLTWTKQFSIYDEADAQSLVKEIVTQELQLDPKRFEPKKVRWAISNAKNQGWLPEQLEANAEGQRGKLTADVYRRYRKALAANNALDFDDLLLLPVQLLQQNEQVRGYWHRRFAHVLVDEYQDTNRTQYELIKLVTDGKDPQHYDNWSGRSLGGERCRPTSTASRPPTSRPDGFSGRLGDQALRRSHPHHGEAGGELPLHRHNPGGG